MLTPNLILSASIALSAVLPIQDLSQRLHPIPAPPRDAGVLHLATGTWTRKVQSAALGADIIYNNTCAFGYFGGLSVAGEVWTDEGRVPSPTGPSNDYSFKPGCASAYTVDGFEMAYCTDMASPDFQIDFRGSYYPCTSVIGVPSTSSILLNALPGSPSAAVQCWTVTVDLAGSSQAFTLPADGDGIFQGPSTRNNTFGWSIMCPNLSGMGTGPLIAGSPGYCLGFDGTRWDPVVNYNEPGTGMSSEWSFRVDGGAYQPGCYDFGHTVFSSFHLKLYSDVACPAPPGQPYCASGAPGVACPCGNSCPYGGTVGCRNSLGGAMSGCGKLVAQGVASLSADSVVLEGAGMTLTSSALYFQGTALANGGLGIAFGDGLRCAGGSVRRLATRTNAGGASRVPSAGEPPLSVLGQLASPGTVVYQIWYRDASTYCTPSTFNLSNGYSIPWAP